MAIVDHLHQYEIRDVWSKYPPVDNPREEITRYEEEFGCVLPTEAKEALVTLHGLSLLGFLFFARPEFRLQGKVDNLAFVSFAKDRTSTKHFESVTDVIGYDLLPGFFPLGSIGDYYITCCISCRSEKNGWVYITMPRHDVFETTNSNTSSLYIPYEKSLTAFIEGSRTIADEFSYDLDIANAESLDQLPTEIANLPWREDRNV